MSPPRKTPALTPGLLVCLFYLDFSFDEGGDVVLVLEDGEGLQQVVLEPLPVLRDLLARASWRGEGAGSEH